MRLAKYSDGLGCGGRRGDSPPALFGDEVAIKIGDSTRRDIAAAEKIVTVFCKHQ